MRTNSAIQERKNIKCATIRMTKTLDAKYKKANLKEITNKLKYSHEQLLIYMLLNKHKNIFDSTIGNYTGTGY